MDFYLLLPSYCELKSMTAEARRCTISSQGIKSKRSELPQHSHSFADAHVMIVEVTEPSKGESREHQKACLGSFLHCISMNIVSNNLSNAPEGKKKNHSTNEKPQVMSGQKAIQLTWLHNIISQDQNAIHGNKCMPGKHVNPLYGQVTLLCKHVFYLFSYSLIETSGRFCLWG